MHYFEELDVFFNSDHGKKLIAGVKRGEWALMIGAGFSADAKTSLGQSCLTGDQLCDLLGNALGYKREQSSRLGLQKLYTILKEKDADFLKKSFLSVYSDVQPTWHKVITNFSWRKIFTTNIDDVVETAYKQNSASFQRMVSKGFSDPISINNNSSMVQVIHLHGSCKFFDKGIIFSPGEYASIQNKSFFAFHDFSREMLSGKIIYLGTRLNEPDFNFYLEQRLSGGYEKNPLSAVIISSSIEKADADYYNTLGLISIKATSEDFFKKLDEATSPRQPLIRSTPLINEQKMSVSERTSVQAFLNSFYSLPADSEVALAPSAFSFFEGGSLSLEDLKNSNDCALIQTVTALNYAKEWANNPAANSRCIYLYGASGGGKTSSLKRVAYELAELGQNIWLFKGEDWIRNPKDLARCLPSRFVLAIDKIEHYSHQIESLVQELSKVQKSCLIVCASREIYKSSVFPVLQSAFSDQEELKLVECNWLNSEDTLALARHLMKKERLGLYLRGKTEPEIQEFFLRDSSKILLAAMTKAFTGKGHLEIIKDEFEQLSPEGKEIYSLVSLVHSRGEPLDSYILSRSYSGINNDIWTRINSQIASPHRSSELNTIVRGVTTGGHHALETRHSFIAEQVIKLNSNKVNLEYVKRLCHAISPFISEENRMVRNSVFRLGKLLVDQKWLSRDLCFSEEQIDSLFNALEEEWHENYHFWIQRATFELHRKRNFKSAWDYCKTALDIDPRGYVARITLGNVCLHWAKQEDKPSAVQKLIEEADENLKSIALEGKPDYFVFVVMLKGLMHTCKQKRWFKEYEKDLNWWINTAREKVHPSSEFLQFLRVCERILKTGIINDGLRFDTDISDVDLYYKEHYLKLED